MGQFGFLGRKHIAGLDQIVDKKSHDFLKGASIIAVAKRLKQIFLKSAFIIPVK
jgi:hypothetical protein